MKCKFCKNYLEESDNCKFCKFEFNEDYNPFLRDDWDIFELEDDYGWSHIQIMDRLYLKGIDCYYADMWPDDDMAFLMGCNSNQSEIANALNLHKDSIYPDDEHCMFILNLYKEKCIRKKEGDKRWD